MGPPLCSRRFVAIPLYVWRTYEPWIAEIEVRGEPARLGGYKETILIWFVAALALFGLWIGAGREWSALGLRFSDPSRFAVGAVLGLGIVLLLWWQLRVQLPRVLGGTVTRHALKAQMGQAEALIPGTRRERFWFRLMSLNAGVTEELIFRGFLLWYLEHFVGLPVAVVLTIVLFALAHSYQGLKQLPGIALAAGLMMALYLISGSIWLPMLVHAVADSIQGDLIGGRLRAQGLAVQE